MISNQIMKQARNEAEPLSRPSGTEASCRFGIGCKRRGSRIWLATLGLAAAMLGTGCQVDMAGQTLPSPYYLTDDVQFFPPGTEFLLSNEAAAMADQAEEIASESP